MFEDRKSVPRIARLRAVARSQLSDRTLKLPALHRTGDRMDIPIHHAQDACTRRRIGG